MVVYFVAFKVTGVIGLIGTILGALYTFAVGLILNFIIQRARGSDLRLRIANSGGFFTLLREFYASGQTWSSPTHRTSILFGFMLLVLAGNAIPFIVTTGIKANIGIRRQPSMTWKNPRNAIYNYLDIGQIMETRQNSSDLLTALYNSHNLINYPGVDFNVLSQATPTTICGVNTNYVGPVAIEHPTPGTISLTRQLYTFSKDVSPTCEQTSNNCEITSMRTTLALWADYGSIFDTPWVVTYNDHQGNPTTIANLSSAISMGNSNRDGYIAERPTTFIAGYTESNGVSVMAAFTTASFSTQLYDSQRFVDTAQSAIGSLDPLYPSIFDALNTSAFTPPLIGYNASTKVTLVYNTPSAPSDNSTHITCVGYEANTLGLDQQSPAVNMISCRELRISVMTNTGAQPDSSYTELNDYSMLRIYNSTAPLQMDLLQIANSGMHSESITAAAAQVADLLYNLTERLYPFAATVQGVVQPYEYVEGISFERWSLVFIGVLVGIIAVIFVMDRMMVDAISKADVLTLIENTTKNYNPKDGWKPKYPTWSLAQQEGSYRVLLRGEKVSLEKNSELQRLKDNDHA
ncbi:hypothetical protein EDD21DRAFT_388059 [Dissophora ornata]|nr:hypothetical protein BGZ58_008499 [Dissophora ornata]KAI8596504.1 hypothetical protein EDD21DRAFT_388059 [Dissophora ornata]